MREHRCAQPQVSRRARVRERRGARHFPAPHRGCPGSRMSIDRGRCPCSRHLELPRTSLGTPASSSHGPHGHTTTNASASESAKARHWEDEGLTAGYGRLATQAELPTSSISSAMAALCGAASGDDDTNNFRTAGSHTHTVLDVGACENAARAAAAASEQKRT